MSCPTELTLSIYADGELSSVEQRLVAAHLDGCASCRSLFSALERENVVLMGVLRGEEVRTLNPASGAVATRWLWGAAALVLLAPAALSWVWRGLPSLPLGLGWLGDLAGPWELLALLRGLWRFSAGGDELAMSALGFVMTLLCALGLLASMALRRQALGRVGAGVLAALVLSCALPETAHAADVRHQKDGAIKIGANEIIDDSAFLSGKTVVVAGVVEGDVFAAAERVEIAGTVRGNLYSASQSLKLSGKITGNVHAVCEELELTGKVGGAGFVAGKNLTLGAASELSRDAYLAGESVRAQGRLGRGVYFAAESIELGGSVERSLTGYANQVALGSSARVGGGLQLTVPSKDAVVIDDGAEVKGPKHVEVKKDEEDRDFLHLGFYLATLARALALLLLGLVTITLFPAALPRAPVSSMQLLRNMAIGFVVIVATPVAMLLVALTVIGIPIAVVAAMLYALLAYASTLLVAYFIAERLPAPSRGRTLLNTALVLLALLLVVQLPLVGFGLNFLIHVLGVGYLSVHIKEQYDKRRAATATPA